LLYLRCKASRPTAHETPYESCSEDSDLNSGFHALPGLKVDGFNTVLLFLAMAVTSNTPVKDPWFRTDIPTQSSEILETLYVRHHFTRALACAEKVEICKPQATGPPQCVQISPSGWPQFNPEENITQMLGLSQRQSAVADRLQDACWIGDFTAMLRDLTAER
jgi:hypothetical protein